MKSIHFNKYNSHTNVLKSLAIAVALFALPVVTMAANVTQNYNFTISKFMECLVAGPCTTTNPAPTDPVVGSVTLTYDPTLPININNPQPVTVNAVTLMIGGHKYTTAELSAYYDGEFMVGTNANGNLGAATMGTDTFSFIFSPTTLILNQFTYATAIQQGIWTAGTTTTGSPSSITQTAVTNPGPKLASSEGQGAILDFGPNWIKVGTQIIAWNTSTRYKLNDAKTIAPGMIAQWKGTTDTSTGIITATKLEIN